MAMRDRAGDRAGDEARGIGDGLRGARRTDAALGTTVARLDALLERAPVAFAFFDVEFHFVRVNGVFARLFGLEVDGLLGRRVEEALPSLWPRVRPLFLHVMRTGEQVADVEVTGMAADQPGVERHWLAGLFPVRAADGTMLGPGALVVDITERARAARELALLARASELFAEPLDAARAHDRVARLALPEFADACVLTLQARDHLLADVVIAHRDAETERALRVLGDVAPEDRRPGPVVDRVLREGVPVLVDGSGLERATPGPAWPRRDFLERLSPTSALAVPLAVGPRMLGAITFVFTTTSARRYHESDIELGAELGRRIAQLLETLRLEADARRDAARLDLLARTGEVIEFELDARQRVRRLARLVLPEFADMAGIYLVDGDEVRLVAGSHADPRAQQVLDGGPLPTHALRCGLPPCEATRTGRPVLLADVPLATATALAGALPGQDHELGPPSVRSMLSVPLPGPDAPLGAISFAYGPSGRRYGPDDVPLAQELARRVGAAVEHARRYEHERGLVESLQRTLLPAALPAVPGLALAGRYLPGAAGLKVGGDWYDALALPDGSVFLAIGDVVGHGLPAAASMGRLRDALQIFALEGLEPAAMLGRLNRHCLTLGDVGMATVTVLRYDPATGRVCVASAGHLPALLRHPDGRVVPLDGASGVPIAASSHPHYEQATHRLPPGSLAVLYTDGLVERREESLDAGLARLEAALAAGPGEPEALADHLLGALLAGPDPADDVALLVCHPLPVLGALDLRLPAHPRELVSLRRVLGEWLSRHGVDHEASAEVTLAVNEAVGNAVEHAYGLDGAEIRVQVTHGDGVLDVMVRDFGRWRPHRPVGGVGHGLRLMSSLMTEVDVSSSGDGTEVRMRRVLRSAAEPES